VPKPKKKAGGESKSSQPILVATDFSADSDAALIWASNYADTIGAPVRILHVVHDPAEAAGFYRKGSGDEFATMTEVAEKMMAKYVAKMRKANPKLAALQAAESEMVSGLPSGRIVEAAKRDGAQMIVLGSRGRTGLAHILVGSVAERVAETAPMPVVIVKRPEEK
jgi:nucleotide-binding universal stress UspA family protein